MGAIWRGISRTIFWSYERGSWPYDLMVLTIVLFVLFTPRGWFHDQPQSGVVTGADVQMIADDAASHTQTYRIDAQLLAPDKRVPRPTPELERQTHEILGKTVEELKGQRFQITHIAPGRSDDGGVLYYDVAVKR
ncbi:MAG: hypothetical protein ACRD4K_06870 [Candidatus Acidiferrales bacterium]